MTTATKLIAKAAQNLNIPFTFIDPHESVIALSFPQKTHYIFNTALGLVSDSDTQLAADKNFHYLLLKDTIHMPLTQAYLDPNSKYGHLTSQTIDQITTDILKRFKLPLIIKKNQGMQGVNVFKVESAAEIPKKISTIFNPQHQHYDYVVLAQEYIEAAKEYRVVTYNHKLMVAYWKDITEATYHYNLSPLHWENARAVKVSTQQLDKLHSFLQPLFEVWPLKYAGFDIIEDHKGQLWLIEVNTKPGLAYYLKDNDEADVLELYTLILADLKRAYS